MTGAEIKAARLKMGLSQADFGKLLGYSRFAVLDWEKGRFSPPPDLLERITKADPSVLPAKPGTTARAQQIADTYSSLRRAGRTHHELAAYLRTLPDMTQEAWQIIGREWNV